MKKSVLLLLLSALFTCGSVYAQLRVTGTVLDAATGEPMAGASVIEQGTTSGTTTDTKGRFAISVKNHQSVLTFSFIGMVPQNIMVGSNTDLRVELQQDVTQIENVVVQIGYGDAQKKNVAGSLGVLSTSEITKSKGTSFMDALQGRMAGVQVSSSSGEPGAGIDITIRGGNSINAGTQPLYIIDDVQIDVNADEVATSSYTSANVRYNPLAGINPSDIESITVLKDASATAIYGSRGANGVVIITTKSGRGEKASVDFDMSVGLARMSNTIDVLQGQEFADYRFAKFPTSDAWGIDTNGDGLPDRVRDFSDYPSRNWQEEVMRTGIIQSYNIGVASGGSAKTKVAASAGYLNQEGIVKKNQMERFTGRIRFDSDLSKRFTIGGTINFSHIVTKGAVTNAGANSYNGLVQSFVLYKPIFLSEDDDEASNPENYNLTNPITFINDSYKASTQNRTIGDLYLKYKILNNLTLRISGGGTILNSKTEEWYPSTTSWGVLQKRHGRRSGKRRRIVADLQHADLRHLARQALFQRRTGIRTARLHRHASQHPRRRIRKPELQRGVRHRSGFRIPRKRTDQPRTQHLRIGIPAPELHPRRKVYLHGFDPPRRFVQIRQEQQVRLLPLGRLRMEHRQGGVHEAAEDFQRHETAAQLRRDG